MQAGDGRHRDAAARRRVGAHHVHGRVELTDDERGAPGVDDGVPRSGARRERHRDAVRLQGTGRRAAAAPVAADLVGAEVHDPSEPAARCRERRVRVRPLLPVEDRTGPAVLEGRQSGVLGEVTGRVEREDAERPRRVAAHPDLVVEGHEMTRVGSPAGRTTTRLEDRCAVGRRDRERRDRPLRLLRHGVQTLAGGRQRDEGRGGRSNEEARLSESAGGRVERDAPDALPRPGAVTGGIGTDIQPGHDADLSGSGAVREGPRVRTHGWVVGPRTHHPSETERPGASSRPRTLPGSPQRYGRAR